MVNARPCLQDSWIGFAFFVLAVLSIASSRFDGGIAYVWVASALLISVLVNRPRRQWWPPLCWSGLASMAATASVGVGAPVAIPLMLANLAEAVVVASLLRWRASRRRPLGSIGWALDLAVAGGIAGPLAFGGLAGLTMWAWAGHDPLVTIARALAGHGLSNLTFLPLIGLYVLGRHDPKLSTMDRHCLIEKAVLFTAQIAITIAVFCQASLPLLFLPVLPTVIIAFRCGTRRTAVSLMLLAMISGAFTFLDCGPVHLFHAPRGLRMQLLQFYLLATVHTVVPIAAELRNRARLLRKISNSEARYRMLADHSSDIVMHTDTRGRLRFVSPSIERIGGYSPSEMIGASCMAMIDPAYRDLVADHYRFTLTTPGVDSRFEYRARCKDGTWRWFESYCRAAVEPDGTVGVVSTVRDISERKSREEQLATAAMTDFLTGLPNRRAFRAAADRVVGDKRVQRSVIALIDIDHFKQVNDRFGHDAGDEVLQNFAAIAQHRRRQGDVLARIGGEEFAILLPGLDVRAALTICDRLRAEVAASRCATGAGPIRVTISGGVAVLDERGIDDALKRADIALYAAKTGGRDRLHLAA